MYKALVPLIVGAIAVFAGFAEMTFAQEHGPVVEIITGMMWIVIGGFFLAAATIVWAIDTRDGPA